MNSHGAIDLSRRRPQYTREDLIRRHEVLALEEPDLLGMDGQGRPIWKMKGGASLFLAEPVDPFHQSAGTAINTFTTNRDVSPNPCPIIFGGRLKRGVRVKVEAQGNWGATGTPTLQLGIYVGLPGATGQPAALTSILAQSAAITTSALTSIPWRMEYLGLITVDGTSGTILGQGDLEFGTSLTAFSSNAIPTTAAARTVTRDTTIAWCFGICAAFSVSNAANQVQVDYLNVLIMNG